MGAVSHCSICGDFLFNGRHRGNVERWCRELSETKTSGKVCETKTCVETKTPGETKTLETKTGRETKTRNKGGRPRRQTIPPWEVAGMSRATWYRQRQNQGADIKSARK
jgi:hypothetical protein